MSVINGQRATAENFNAAFASKSSDNISTGKQTLSRPASGSSVVDVQQAINDNIADIIAAQLDIDTHQADLANPHATTKAQVGLGNADDTSDLNKPISTATQAALDLKIDLTEKGSANGVVPLNGSVLIDSSYLPSYVDDVIEVADYAALPVTGETGKIYVTLDTGKSYRWSGSVYYQLTDFTDTDDLPQGSTNLYYSAALAQADTYAQSIVTALIFG